MKLLIVLALFLSLPPLAFAQLEEPPFPYESPEDITLRTGWQNVAFDAYVEVMPPSSMGPSEDALVDGLNRENESAQFVAWQGVGEPLEIILDLEQNVSDLRSFRVFWAVNATGEGGPFGEFVEETVVSVSADGETYTELGIATSEDMSEAGGGDYTIRHVVNDLTLSQPVSAQFIRFALPDPPVDVMCSEVAVLREVAIPGDAVNIAQGKAYVTDPPGNDGSRPDDGIRLTNGALSADASTDTTGWAGFVSTQQISITVDLGETADNLVAFRAWYNAWEFAFVFVVGAVYVEVSEDGSTFTPVGMVPKLYDHDDDPIFSNVPYLLIPETPVRARYVRFWTQASDDNYWDSFASEFEVYQGTTPVESWFLF